jgi:hypothetical protein
LTRIQALSWFHNKSNPLPTTIIPISRITDGFKEGIVIGFNGEVRVGDPLNPGQFLTEIDAMHVFQVLVEHTTDAERRLGLVCRCPIRGQIIPVKLTDDGAGHIISADEVPGPDAPGVAFIFDQKMPIGTNIVRGEVPELWVVLRGDFVVDVGGRAIDAEFVRAELPTGDRPNGSPFGVQGGLFESWFTLTRG